MAAIGGSSGIGTDFDIGTPSAAPSVDDGASAADDSASSGGGNMAIPTSFDSGAVQADQSGDDDSGGNAGSADMGAALIAALTENMRPVDTGESQRGLGGVDLSDSTTAVLDDNQGTDAQSQQSQTAQDPQTSAA